MALTRRCPPPSAGRPDRSPRRGAGRGWGSDRALCAGHSLTSGKHLRKLGAKELIAVKRAFMDIDSDGSGNIDIVEVRDAPRCARPLGGYAASGRPD